MGKKKKASNAANAAASASAPDGASAASVPAAASSGSASDSSSSSSAAATSSTTSASASTAPTPHIQPWLSTYDSLKIIPITPDPHLYLQQDSLAHKVNDNAIPLGSATPATVAATASTGATAASTSSSASAAGASTTASQPQKFLFGIYNSKNDASGRRAIAHCKLPAGAHLLSEEGHPWVIHDSQVTNVCANCAAQLFDSRAPPMPQQTKEGARRTLPLGCRGVGCDKCGVTFYCSAACRTATAPQHKFECIVLQQTDDISDIARINIDLVRAAAKFVVMLGQERQTMKEVQKTIATIAGSADGAATSTADSASASMQSLSLSASSSPAPATSSTGAKRVYDPSHFQSTSSDSALLLDHLSTVPPQQIKTMRDAAGLILKLLPSFADDVSIDEIVSFLGRLNSNCHSLMLSDAGSTQFGFGLFPLAAIFNHSCLPNTSWANEGSKMVFRVIRPVEAHEELTVNYIGLYQTRAMRRMELWKEKAFFCMCRRCTLRPKNEEEKRKIALDGTIGAIRCQNTAAAATSDTAKSASASPLAASHRCTGYYRINYQLLDPHVEAERKRKRAEEKEKKRLAAAAANGEAAGSSNSSSSSSSTSSAAAAPGDDAEEEDDDDGEFPILFRPKVTSARCNVCHHNANPAALTQLQQTALEKSEALLEQYANRRPAAALREEFETFLKQQLEILHPNHAAIFNLTLPLVNLCSALGDYRAKLEYCQRVVQMAAACFPDHFLPQCNYRQALADTYAKMIEKGLQEKTPKKLLQKWKEERIAVLEQRAQSMSICRGPSHLLTLAAQHDVEQAKKMKI